jgi:cyclopropane fatty-acyl-phospholipid synthase-like methyltransferase
MNEQHKNATQKWGIIETHVNFKGKRVLDIGCSEGYGTIEALELGAEYAVGLDNVQWLVDVAQKAKKRLGYTDDQLVFDLLDIEQIPWEAVKALYGDFDIVLGLGLIHHFKIHDYVRNLRKLCKLADDIMVLEFWIDVGVTSDGIREEHRKWTNVIPTEVFMKRALKGFDFRVVKRGVINYRRREVWICQRITE